MNKLSLYLYISITSLGIIMLDLITIEHCVQIIIAVLIDCVTRVTESVNNSINNNTYPV
jgi:hypothetical protein